MIKTGKKFRIAIVGFGAAGLAFLSNFFHGFRKKNYPLEIVIYEKKEHFAKGSVYQDDKDHILLNRHYYDMSIGENHNLSFKNWIDLYRKKEKNKYRGYFPRSFFGEYMKSQYLLLKNKYQDTITERHCRVADIILNSRQKYSVICENQTADEFDAVILAIGHTEPANIYNITKNYINNPYPSSVLQTIPPDKNVGIIGTGLTAIDVALSLNVNNHKGQITLFSRSGWIYDKKEAHRQYPLKYFNDNFITDLTNEEAKLKLALKYFYKELKTFGLNGIKQAYAQSSYLNVDLKNLQSLMFNINLNIEKLWLDLSESEKAEFFRKYFNFWLKKRASIAPQNYEKLIALILEGKINVLPGLTEVETTEDTIIFHCDKTVSIDFVINATGSPRNLQTTSTPLIQKLINHGLAVYDDFGGIKVNKSTNELIARDGNICRNLYAIGNITCGTFLFTSYITHVVARAKFIVEHISKTIN